jgi:hypothetical protein
MNETRKLAALLIFDVVSYSEEQFAAFGEAAAAFKTREP